MTLDFEKLAGVFEVAAGLIDEDERLVLSAAIETVLLEKQAGRLPEDLDEAVVVLLGSAIADEFLKE
jgi:hypothetical protein